ncbi:MAG TPA: alpha/beta hydrolase [Bdellovibrionales bacterium]|nr:alpha/beta hydrolase [Bdellovibrionales bacterium]
MLEIPQELKSVFPYKTQTHRLPSGMRLAYVDEGQGEVILALHGNPTWSFYYRHVIAQLKSQYRVIALDNLGMGLSDRPESYEDLTLEQHITNVFDLVHQLGIKRCTLIGHDWGGAISTGVATLAAQHQLEISKIILMNTAAFADPNIPWQIALCRVPMLGNLMVRGFNLFAWPATSMLVANPLGRVVKRGLLFPYQNYRARIGVHAFVRDIPMEPGHPTRQVLDAIERAIPGLSAPFLFIWGGRDFCFTRHFLDRWLKLQPAAELVFLKDAGHYVLEDAPETVTTAIQNFLARSPHEVRAISPVQ